MHYCEIFWKWKNGEPGNNPDADDFLLEKSRFYCVVQKCLNMVPPFPNERNCSLAPLETLQLRLIDDRTTENARDSAITDEHKKFEDLVRDLSSDF